MAGDTAQPGLDRAERCWRAAFHYRQLIERAERGVYGYPPETTAYLLKLAEGFEYEARQAERGLD
jgi:hypothetical protein